MKVTCSVIQDVLPLYAENLVCADTRGLVEEHLKVCEPCREALEELHAPAELPPVGQGPLKRIRSELRKRRYLAILLGAVLAIAALGAVLGYLTAPRYIPSAAGSVSILEADEFVIARFGGAATNLEIESYRSENGEGAVVHITAYDSVWSQSIAGSGAGCTVLNPGGERIESVYYSPNDGTENVLLYGEDLAPDGGIITLPRLVLGYYAVLALALFTVSGLAWFILRRNVRIAALLSKITFVPLAYLLAQTCVMGFSLVSYSIMHDFCAILLVSVPLYIALCLGQGLLHRRACGR